jgi:hypothetical protein
MVKTLTKDEVAQILRAELPYLRERFGVNRIAFYGSFAKGTSKRTSDVDVLVELGQPLGLDFVELAFHLEEVLGRRVDLATFDTFHRNRHNPRYERILDEIERTLSYV